MDGKPLSLHQQFELPVSDRPRYGDSLKIYNDFLKWSVSCRISYPQWVTEAIDMDTQSLQESLLFEIIRRATSEIKRRNQNSAVFSVWQTFLLQIYAIYCLFKGHRWRRDLGQESYPSVKECCVYYGEACEQQDVLWKMLIKRTLVNRMKKVGCTYWDA